MIKEKLVQVVGAKNVDNQESTLASYTKDMSFVKPMRPAAVVKIKKLEDVQKLIKLAKETKFNISLIAS